MPSDPQPTVEDFQLIQTLTPDRTFLCTDASSNRVVLVRLEDDCLHRNGLHPSIRDRLARVRELPHPCVATLRGVERWNGAPFMVWTWLDGENWDDLLWNNPQAFPTLASSLAANVLALHDLGIVHGNLHGRNIIVRPDGQTWLTQLSPYLYADPDVDMAAFSQMLAVWRERLSPDAQSRLDLLLARLDAKEFGLKDVSHALLKLNQIELPKGSNQGAMLEPGYRRSSVVSAIVIAVIAISIALLVCHHFSNLPFAQP